MIFVGKCSRRLGARKTRLAPGRKNARAAWRRWRNRLSSKKKYSAEKGPQDGRAPRRGPKVRRRKRQKNPRQSVFPKGFEHGGAFMKSGGHEFDPRAKALRREHLKEDASIDIGGAKERKNGLTA